jgi:hypothetical protein
MNLKTYKMDNLNIGRSIKLLLVFDSTVIPGFSLLETHDQDFCYVLDIYVFRNAAWSLTRGKVSLSM